MLKLFLFTGIRNAELADTILAEVDLDQMKICITEGKGWQDRYVLFHPHFRGELARYVAIQQEKGAVYLFESNLMTKFTTRRIREITRKYARKAGITKRIHPHLFRHLTGILSVALFPLPAGPVLFFSKLQLYATSIRDHYRYQ
jgi:integrase/recombinase XerD